MALSKTSHPVVYEITYLSKKKIKMSFSTQSSKELWVSSTTKFENYERIFCWTFNSFSKVDGAKTFAEKVLQEKQKTDRINRISSRWKCLLPNLKFPPTSLFGKSYSINDQNLKITCDEKNLMTFPPSGITQQMI